MILKVSGLISVKIHTLTSILAESAKFKAGNGELLPTMEWSPGATTSSSGGDLRQGWPLLARTRLLDSQLNEASGLAAHSEVPRTHRYPRPLKWWQQRSRLTEYGRVGVKVPCPSILELTAKLHLYTSRLSL